MDIQHILLTLGFSKKEVSVYLSTLELGIAPASVIARKARLKRPTTYEVLSQLIEKGVGECFLERKLKNYSVISPVELHRKYTEYLQNLGIALPEMMARHNAIFKKPRITYYEGKEELKRLYLDVLNAPGEILNYFLPEKPFQYFTEAWVYKHHIEERVRRGIQIRVIMPQSGYAKRYISRSDKELRQTRIIQKSELFFTNETFIYGNKMSTFSFDEDFAMVVESPDVIRTQRVLFELAWNSALVR